MVSGPSLRSRRGHMRTTLRKLRVATIVGAVLLTVAALHCFLQVCFATGSTLSPLRETSVTAPARAHHALLTEQRVVSSHPEATVASKPWVQCWSSLAAAVVACCLVTGVVAPGVLSPVVHAEPLDSELVSKAPQPKKGGGPLDWLLSPPTPGDENRESTQGAFLTFIIGLPVVLLVGVLTDNIGWWNYDADGKKFNKTPGRYYVDENGKEQLARAPDGTDIYKWNPFAED